MHCKDHNHLKDIDVCCKELIKIALESDHVFPRKNGNNRRLCGWQESMKEYKEDSQFWYHAWLTDGKPREGAWSFEMMRQSKRQYMYAVRRLKRRQNMIKELKFAEAIASDNSRDFFREVRRMNPKPEPANLINGEVNEEAIVDVFRTKYESLYNSVASDPVKLEAFENDLNRKIIEINGNPLLNVGFVSECISKLKHCKDDGDVHYNSSHLLYSSLRYKEKVTCLFNAMYTHGYLASQILNATIVSIPKDLRKSLCDD